MEARSMNDEKIETMVRDAIRRSIAKEYRAAALTWFDRQMILVRAHRELGFTYPDDLNEGDQ
jgi:hypothetical protein